MEKKSIVHEKCFINLVIVSLYLKVLRSLSLLLASSTPWISDSQPDANTKGHLTRQLGTKMSPPWSGKNNFQGKKWCSHFDGRMLRELKFPLPPNMWPFCWFPHSKADEECFNRRITCHSEEGFQGSDTSILVGRSNCAENKKRKWSENGRLYD